MEVTITCHFKHHFTTGQSGVKKIDKRYIILLYGGIFLSASST